MESRKVGQVAEFSKPGFTGWDRIDSNEIELVPTPLAMQPNGFVEAAFEEGSYGLTASLVVKSVHDEKQITFWMQWSDETQDRGEGEGFPDGAVIAFPVRGDPAIHTMGEDTAPIHAIHWSARKNQVRSVLATGIGTSRPGPDLKPHVNAAWIDGQWTIVVTHNLGASDPDSVKLVPNKTTGIGFVIWDGSKMERAGIKAYSPDWVDLNITK